MTSFQIRIPNWEKYNVRNKDYKRRYWFALSHDIFFDHKIMEVDGDAFRAFIYALCEASKADTDSPIIYLNHASLALKLTHAKIQGSFKMLEKNLIISTVSDCGQIESDCGQHITEQNITNITEQNNIAHFEHKMRECYELYPSKKGKQRGMQMLKKQLKSEKDFEDFKKAVENYAADIQNNGTESKYIKHFSTFANCWKDWIEVQSEDAPGAIAARIAKRLREGNLT